MVEGVLPGAADGAHHLMAVLSGRCDGTTGRDERGRGDVGVRIDPRHAGNGACGLNHDVDVGQTMLDSLERPDRNAELVPIGGVVHREAQHRLRHADGLVRQSQTSGGDRTGPRDVVHGRGCGCIELPRTRVHPASASIPATADADRSVTRAR